MVGVFVSKLVPLTIVLHPPLCAAPSPRGGAQYPVKPKPPWAAGFRVDPALQHCPAGLLPSWAQTQPTNPAPVRA